MGKVGWPQFLPFGAALELLRPCLLRVENCLSRPPRLAVLTSQVALLLHKPWHFWFDARRLIASTLHPMKMLRRYQAVLIYSRMVKVTSLEVVW